MLGCGGPNQVPLDFAWRGWDLNPRSLTYEDSEMAELLYPDMRLIPIGQFIAYRIRASRRDRLRGVPGFSPVTVEAGFPYTPDRLESNQGPLGFQPSALTKLSYEPIFVRG